MTFNRRTFLRGAGACIALPALESFGSPRLASEVSTATTAAIANDNSFLLKSLRFKIKEY